MIYCVYVLCVLLTFFILFFDVFIVCMKPFYPFPRFYVLSSFYIWNLFVFIIIFRSLSTRVCLFIWDCHYRTLFIEFWLIFWMLDFFFLIRGYVVTCIYLCTFWARSQNCEWRLLASSRLSCLSARVVQLGSQLDGIFTKLDIWAFFENLSRKI